MASKFNVMASPADAIKVHIDDPDFAEKTRAKIRSYVNYE